MSLVAVESGLHPDREQSCVLQNQLGHSPPSEGGDQDPYVWFRTSRNLQGIRGGTASPIADELGLESLWESDVDSRDIGLVAGSYSVRSMPWPRQLS